MPKLSEKDRKMLIVLIVFLVGMAYYEFLLVPLFNMNSSVQQSLIDKRKELLVTKTKLGGLNNFRKKINDLKEVICISEKNNKMPDLSEQLNNKMKAVMSAANNASVTVSSLKPMNVISEGEDGSVQTIKDKYISIDGKSDLNSFLKFLKNLWGTELDEIELSSASKDGTMLRFYIKITFLPKIQPGFEIDNSISCPTVDFGVKHNIFAMIKPPPPPPPPKPKTPPPPPRKIHSLSGAKLLGIAEFGKEKMAIIEDSSKRETDFFLAGDVFRDAKVLKITENSVEFIFSDGQTLTLELPKEKQYYDIGDNQSKKKGHLGILAETFTEQLARQYDTEFRPGLLVISSGAHGDKLQKGDVITSINGQTLTNFEDALNVMKSIYAGDDLNIVLYRKDKMMNISYKAD